MEGDDMNDFSNVKESIPECNVSVNSEVGSVKCELLHCRL